MAVVIGVNIELEMYTFDSWSYNFSARNPLRDYNLLERVLKRTEADLGGLRYKRDVGVCRDAHRREFLAQLTSLHARQRHIAGDGGLADRRRYWFVRLTSSSVDSLNPERAVSFVVGDKRHLVSNLEVSIIASSI